MKKMLSRSLITLAAMTAAGYSFAADLDAVPALESVETSKSFLPGDFSVSAGVYTDYRFRGISQTDSGPAFQGTLGWSIETPVKGVNFDLGLFGSNINFTPNSTPEDGSLEIDYIAGFSGTVKDINWAVAGYYYTYPDADGSLDFNYYEIGVSLDKDIFSGFNVGVNYFGSPDNFGNSGAAHFIQGTASYEIPGFDLLPLTIDGSLGYQFVAGDGDYLTWHVGLTAQVHEHASLGVQYVDTNTTVLNDDLVDIADAAIVGFFTVDF